MRDPVPMGRLPAPVTAFDSTDLRSACSEAVKGGGFRPLGPVFHMASAIAFEGGLLRLRFPANVRNTAQDLLREQANPHLLAALGTALPGLRGLEIAFEEPKADRPEERLRQEPALQELLRLSGGEITDIRKEG